MVPILAVMGCGRSDLSGSLTVDGPGGSLGDSDDRGISASDTDADTEIDTDTSPDPSTTLPPLPTTAHPSECGNGIIEADEQCDPGAAAIGPEQACVPGCALNVCGDGMPGPDESCDDGDGDDDDACHLDCTETRAISLSLGGSHSCAVLDTGSVRCWGNGNSGRTGQGNIEIVGDDEPAALTDVLSLGTSAAQIVTGVAHTCVRYSDGALRCFGRSVEGQLGYGVLGDVGDDELPSVAPFVPVGGVVETIATSSGAFHSCALLAGGDVRCWGLADAGRLGVPGLSGSWGDDELASDVPLVDVAGTVVDVGVGAEHSCARYAGGGVRCWGSNESGQLGLGQPGDVGDDETPGSVPPISLGGPVVEMAVGFFHTCVRLEVGAVRCWGRGNNGRLGYGNIAWIGDNEVPSAAGNVEVGGEVVQLTAGNAHTCALLDDGSVRCWGWAGLGQLGYGNLQDIGDDELPADVGEVPVGGRVLQIVAGGNHTCALLEAGSVRCWGSADLGRLGYGDLEPVGDDETPAEVGDVPFLPL